MRAEQFLSNQKFGSALTFLFVSSLRAAGPQQNKHNAENLREISPKLLDP
jgi:hypothetical protein